MKRILVPEITVDPCVVFWDLNDHTSLRIQKLRKQENDVFRFWQKVLSKPFNAIGVYVLEEPDFPEYPCRILTKSLRDTDAFQLTFIAYDGEPSYHTRFYKKEMTELIHELMLISEHNGKVVAECL